MDRFIDAVKLHPCLWNPVHTEYRDPLAKDIAWDNVIRQARITSINTVAKAKMEWKKLRDNHRDALKRAKLGKNKLLPAQITTWKYAKRMQFLEPHMKYRVTENLDQDQAAGAEETNFDVTTTSFDGPSGSCSNMKCFSKTPTEEQKRSSNYDGLQAFFSFLLNNVRSMPPSVQSQVKKKLFDVVIEAEELIANAEAMNPNIANFAEAKLAEANSNEMTIDFQKPETGNEDQLEIKQEFVGHEMADSMSD